MLEISWWPANQSALEIADRWVSSFSAEAGFGTICGWYENTEAAAVEGSDEESDEVGVSGEEATGDSVSTFVSSLDGLISSRDVVADTSSP